MENTKSKSKYYLTRHKYYEKNKAEFRKYYDENKDKIIEQHKEYYKNNKGIILRKQKIYNMYGIWKHVIFENKIPIIKYVDEILVYL